MGKITTKKRILFSFRGQVTINGQIMSEKPGIFCAQNGQKIVGFRTAWGGNKQGETVSENAYFTEDSTVGEVLADSAFGANRIWGLSLSILQCVCRESLFY